jgi:hypothetical protein
MTMMLTRFGFRLKIVVMKPVKTNPAPATSEGANHTCRITFVDIPLDRPDKRA